MTRIIFLFLLWPFAALAALPGDPVITPYLWHLENVGQEWRMEDGKSGKHGRRGADIHVLDAWKIVDAAPDVTVAVIDGGFDFQHPDLRDELLVERAFSFLTNSAVFEKPEESWDVHGNLVAGVIGANGMNAVGVTGISRHSRILPIEAIPGGMRSETDENVAKAIRYAVDQGARVINCSFGKYEPSDAAVESAVAYAREHGAVIVAGAGNDHRNFDKTPLWPAGFARKFDNVISVAATDREDHLWSGSNFGMQIDLAAPGSEILSTGSSVAPPANGISYEYFTASGTSLATPAVAGVAALMLELRPGLLPGQVKEILVKSVDVLPGLRGKVRASGRLNAAKALRMVRELGN